MGLFNKKNSSNQSQGSISVFWNSELFVPPSPWHSEVISNPAPGYNGLVELSNEYIGRDVAVVELEVDLPFFNEVKLFRGEAKRSPEDEQNDDLAATLAYARAFTAVANKLNKRAAGLLKHQDDVLAMKAKARAEKAAKVKREATAAKRRATIEARLNSARK